MMAQATLVSRLSTRWQASLNTTQARAAGVVALVALAVGTRFWHITHKSLWLDEVLSWQAARVPPSEWADYVGAHPPLYFGMLHLWVNVAGDSEAALRAPSAIAGAATIILLAFVASRVGGVMLGAAAAAMLLLNSTHLYFSQEVRMYAPMGLLSLAATVALAGFIKRPSLRWLATYAALMLCVIYTHYSSFVVFAAHGCVIAGYGLPKLWRERNPSILGGGLFAFALAGVAFLPWLSKFRQDRSLGAPHMPDTTWTIGWDALQGALGLALAPTMWFWLLAMPLLVLGIYGIARRWRDPLPVCLGALALVPVAQFVISIQVTTIFSLRQISPYVPALVFVLALGFVEALRPFGRFNLPGRLAGALVAVAVGGTLLVFMFKGVSATYSAPPREDWRAAAANLRDFDGPIYITAPYMLGSFKYYYGNKPNVQPFGFWSPEGHPAGQTVMIGISHQSGNLVLAALGDNVAIEGQRYYWGILFLEVRVVHHTSTNVTTPPPQQAGSGWQGGSLEYLRTTSDVSKFTCQCELDTNGDGRADEPFTVVIEYFDAGTAPFRLFGPTARAVLATRAMSNTMQWQTANVTLPAGTPVGQTFGLSGGVTLRRLQIIRTQLENVDLFGSYQGATRWILQADGYIQSTHGYSYIVPTIPLDADSNGVIDRAFRIDLEYQASGTRALQIFGLKSGENWAPELLQSTEKNAATGWRAASIEVPQGAHLQTSVFIGKGVTLRSVRITQLSDP